ncbi:hypothetical protein DTO207G8_847 [Paecilomyces variotii]|nr:hypothetical protein DTO207G8_847 [Paecilomyces variotii]
MGISVSAQGEGELLWFQSSGPLIPRISTYSINLYSSLKHVADGTVAASPSLVLIAYVCTSPPGVYC